MLAIIVPYRNREDHLRQFIPHMNKYLPDAKIVVVEQSETGEFNRGRLLNIGFLETTATHYCFHDVDLLPLLVNYYPLEFGIYQLASSEIQKKDYLGGVTLFDAKLFKMTGGYHNNYFHRAEDNEMMFNLKRIRLSVINKFGSFQQLPHPRTGPEFLPELWQKAQQKRNINMLETCKYDLIDRKIRETHTHIKVILL